MRQGSLPRAWRGDRSLYHCWTHCQRSHPGSTLKGEYRLSFFQLNRHDLVTNAKVSQDLDKREGKIVTRVRFWHLNKVQEHCEWLPILLKVNRNGHICF